MRGGRRDRAGVAVTKIETIATSPRGTGDVVRGEITRFHPRGIETDLRLSFGENRWTGLEKSLGFAQPSKPDHYQWRSNADSIRRGGKLGTMRRSGKSCVARQLTRARDLSGSSRPSWTTCGMSCSQTL